MRADFRLNLPPIGSHPLRAYALFKPHYLTVPPVTEELLKALPVLVFAVFFSDDRKGILPAALSVGIGFSILENTAILVQNLTVVTLGWTALRGLSASLMHGLCTMIIGAGLPYVKKQRKLFCTGKGEFIRCPCCGEKTRTKIRDDTILIRHLLYCPKCKAELLVNIRKKSITILERLDAKTQGR